MTVGLWAQCRGVPDGIVRANGSGLIFSVAYGSEPRAHNQGPKKTRVDLAKVAGQHRRLGGRRKPGRKLELELLVVLGVLDEQDGLARAPLLLRQLSRRSVCFTGRDLRLLARRLG